MATIISWNMWSDLLELERNKFVTNRARWLQGNARDSHSGDPGFKSRGRPTWFRFLMVCSIQWQLVADLIEWAHQYFNKLKILQKIISISSSLSECFAQGQVYHCKLRHQGCSSVQRQSSTANSGTKVAIY